MSSTKHIYLQNDSQALRGNCRSQAVLLIGEGADDPRFPGEVKLEETKMEQGDNSRDKGQVTQVWAWQLKRLADFGD